MEQYQITEPVDLLNEEGTLRQAGWAKDLLLRYDRQKINCLPAEGELLLGEQKFLFQPEDSW